MKLINLTVAGLGILATVFSSIPSANALAIHNVNNKAKTVRVRLTHNGAKPIEVRMVALDANKKEIGGLKSFPSTLKVSRTARNVVAKIPEGANYFCATTLLDPNKPSSNVSGVTNLVFQTCIGVGPKANAKGTADLSGRLGSIIQ